MKPDKAGEWHSRDGRKIVVFDWAGSLRWKHCGRYNTSSGLHELDGDDWLPATPPVFPELPPKPRLVYAVLHHAKSWWMHMRDDRFSNGASWESAGRLTVVPHPDNEPEAVRLIEGAKRD